MYNLKNKYNSLNRLIKIFLNELKYINFIMFFKIKF